MKELSPQAEQKTTPSIGWGLLALLARLFIGGVLIVLGSIKAWDPVDFLRQIHAYGILPPGLWMNLVAAVLPWMEILLGVMLIFGIAVRETALLTAGLLLAFTGAVTWRAAAIHAQTGLAWCLIRFDCGCGTGVVEFCHKIGENVLLFALAAFLVWTPGTWTLLKDLFQKKSS